MTIRALICSLVFAASACSESKQQKEARFWLEMVNMETNEVRIAGQVGYCKNPPPEAPVEGLRRCADVLAPAAIAIARPGIERENWPLGSGTYCDLMLDALAFAKRDTPSWVADRDWAAARCCTSRVDSMRSRCEVVGFKK